MLYNRLTIETNEDERLGILTNPQPVAILLLPELKFQPKTIKLPYMNNTLVLPTRLELVFTL